MGKANQNQTGLSYLAMINDRVMNDKKHIKGKNVKFESITRKKQQHRLSHKYGCSNEYLAKETKAFEKQIKL